MKYTLKIHLKNGGEVSSEPFELPWEPENFHLEAEKKDLPKSMDEVDTYAGWRCDLDGVPSYFNYSQIRKCYTKEQALSVDAYMQLTHAMKAYNGDWEPDWNDERKGKCCIIRDSYRIRTSYSNTKFCFLAFPTEELCDEFLKNFHDLIKVFYQIQED